MKDQHNFRYIYKQFKNLIKLDNKVIILLGPRQVGKTTFLRTNFPEASYINLEQGNFIEIFNSRNLEDIKRAIGLSSNRRLLILDEVQRLDDPGLIAKLIHDEMREIKLIISGSSALEIANKASESLAGRKHTVEMLPLTFQEKLIQTKLKSNREFILESLTFGMYPHLLDLKTTKEEYLKEMVDSTILKDVFYLNLVKNTKNLYGLLKLLAYQIGQQVNITDLASRLQISRPTVIDYIEILKRIYVIYTLSPFTKKRRDEIGKTEKVYFWDLGIRNAVINDFSPVEFRNDYGSIFENFVITELFKVNKYEKSRYEFYYWRTKWGSEVDLVMQKDNEIVASEIKTRAGKVTSAFTDTYPDSKNRVITMDNLGSLL